MTKASLVWRLSLGGAICGSFGGIFVGALLGSLGGGLLGNVSLGLDGALFGGCLGCLGGAIYGAGLGARDRTTLTAEAFVAGESRSHRADPTWPHSLVVQGLPEMPVEQRRPA